MKFTTARNVLSGIWLSAALIFGFLLFLKIPDLGDDASEVFKKAGTFVAPFVALVMSFLFGVHKQDKTDTIPNELSFWAALSISIIHVAALFISIFAWKYTILRNMSMADIGLGYFSFFTVMAMNFFFIGVARGK
jgi:cytochrome b561